MDRAYLREGEEPTSWAFSTLAERREPGGEDEAKLPPPTASAVGDALKHDLLTLAPFRDGSFYRASQYRLTQRSPLPFPEYLCVTRNHHNLDWVGERRLKNAVMLLEWVPSVSALEPLSSKAGTLSEVQERRLRNALSLLDNGGAGRLSRKELREVLRSAEDLQLSDAEIDALLGEHGVSTPPLPRRSSPGDAPPAVSRTVSALSFEELREVLISGRYRQIEAGRFFVLLSLQEAETIRCILHLKTGQPLFPGGPDVALSLRCIPAGNRLFDSSFNYKPHTSYQGAVANNCFRFIDSVMHYAPSELNVLLRSLPVPPIERRLFFSNVVQCRRRLAKNWRETPLSKIFTLEDEWAMLAQRAQAVRVREAVKTRIGTLHDAFIKFDYDQNGLLSPGEIYGALEYLNVPDLTPNDVLFFVRSISSKGHLTYANFMELLAPGAEADDEATAVEAGGSLAAPPPLGRQLSRVPPKGEKELEEMLKMASSEETALELTIKETLARQIAEAQKALDDMLVGSDFAWMQQCRKRTHNPYRSRTCCYFDFTRGATGTREGAPLSIQAVGTWTAVRQGDARVPCFRCTAGYMVLRIPFVKNGPAGATKLNQYALTIHFKIASVGLDGYKKRGLLTTGGWDQFAKFEPKSDVAQVQYNEQGQVGAFESFADGDAPTLSPNRWHAVTISVDTVANTITTYIDGEMAMAIKNDRASKDGQLGLMRQLALFYRRDESWRTEGHPTVYLRSATLHTSTLEAEQVKSEHAMLHTLLIEDACAAVPSYMQPPLRAVSGTFESTRALRRELHRQLREATDTALALWTALQPPVSESDVALLMGGLLPHTLAVCARWRLRDESTGELAPVDESVPPHGETLLHACAFAGASCAIANELLEQLLHAGAFANRRGELSGCTALHAAASGGSTAACRLLLGAGCKPEILSSGRRSALWIACHQGLGDVAQLLVREGGVDPYAASGGVEAPMAVLRRVGGEAANALHAKLDKLAMVTTGMLAAPVSEREGASAASAASAVAASTGDRGSVEGDEGDEGDEEDEDGDLGLEVDKEEEVNLLEDDTKISRKLHVHPLVAEARARSVMCSVHGSECRLCPTVRSCTSCCFYVCQGCWDEAKKKVEEAETAKEKARRGLDGDKVGEGEDVADWLHALGRVDELDDGALSGEDDGGDGDDGADRDEDEQMLSQKVAAAKQQQLEQMTKDLYGGHGGHGAFGGGSDRDLFMSNEDEDEDEPGRF